MGQTRAPGGGRRPKPTAIKLLEGNLGKRPLNENEPQPQILPNYPAPDWLNEEARKVWSYLAPELSAIGLLATIDLTLFARYCDAWSRWKRARDWIQEKGEKYPVHEERKIPNPETKELELKNVLIGWRPYPEVSVYNNMHVLLLRLECEFGMTPSARSRIQAFLLNPGGPAPPTTDDLFEYDN